MCPCGRLEPQSDVDQIYQVLRQAGALSGSASVSGGGGGGGVAGDIIIIGSANKNISSAAASGAAVSAADTFAGAVKQLKNGGGKMGATGSSTLAGTVAAAMAQQQQQSAPSSTQQQQQPPLPDINVINVPEYPERVSRRAVGPIKPGGLPQPPLQQNKGLAAPLADISSSGPNESLIFKSPIARLFLSVPFIYYSLVLIV